MEGILIIDGRTGLQLKGSLAKLILALEGIEKI